MVDRESTSPDRAAPQPQPRERPQTRHGDAPAAILGLQRTIGNRAVQRVISTALPPELEFSRAELAQIEKLSEIYQRLSSLALTINQYAHAHGHPEVLAKLTPERRAAVTKLEQSPELLDRLIHEMNDLMMERDAVHAAMGARDVSASTVRRVRPYAPDILLADELD
jgi:hypothetical protein